VFIVFVSVSNVYMDCYVVLRHTDDLLCHKVTPKLHR